MIPASAPDVNPGGPPPAPATSFAGEVSALAHRRVRLVAELRDLTGGPFALPEVLARRDLNRVDAQLSRLAADPRAPLLLADLACRIAALETAAGGAL